MRSVKGTKDRAGTQRRDASHGATTKQGWLRRHARLVAILPALAVAVGLGALYGGLYDVAATRQHTWPVYWLADTAMRYSVARRARDIPIPDLADPRRATRGFDLYRQHCEQCHGGPGVAPDPFALGLTPIPANWVETARRWPTRNIYWIIRHGVKMTGMPAWEHRLSDAEIWDLVAFVEQLALWSPAEYRARIEASRASAGDAP